MKNQSKNTITRFVPAARENGPPPDPVPEKRTSAHWIDGRGITVMDSDGAGKRTSAQWLEGTGITVLDPDGWDRKNFHHSFNVERITREEFQRRLDASTLGRKNNP